MRHAACPEAERPAPVHSLFVYARQGTCNGYTRATG